MCVHMPCGYSLQTIIKAIASFEIVLSVVCLLLVGVSGSLVLACPAYLLSVLNYDTNTNGSIPSPSPLFSEVSLNDMAFNSSILVMGMGPAPDDQNFTLNDSVEAVEGQELEVDVLDLGSPNETESDIISSTANTSVTVPLPPPPIITWTVPEDDFLRFMNSTHSFQVSVVVMMLIYFLCGLTLAFLLLSAAQERHLQKLTVWMVLQSLVNVIRLILFILLVVWMKDTDKRVDVFMYCLLINFYSFTVLSIVHAHRQDILSLYKRDSRSRASRAAANDGGILKQRFIRNVT